MIDAIILVELGALVPDYDFLNVPDDSNEKKQDEDDEGKDGAVQDHKGNMHKISETKVRSAIGNATAFVSVVGEKFELEYVIDNLNTLRAQYNAHGIYKRERLDTLMSIDGRQTARADRPTVNPDGSLTFHYKYDFDKNGMLYYIGTEGLTTEYTNPTEGKRVIVKVAPKALA